ncbi:hypothetical protein EYF80_020096 [Liparis tanakae]|uniref:Uncharacterized protein n=1 Tax=Liparis tanakae TaxID=230148 RepID=A0A4Z2HXS1_9TELE|nr:hypothetical protein EYF80_020096 [Liparis tanakae]
MQNAPDKPSCQSELEPSLRPARAPLAAVNGFKSYKRDCDGIERGFGLSEREPRRQDDSDVSLARRAFCAIRRTQRHQELRVPTALYLHGRSSYFKENTPPPSKKKKQSEASFERRSLHCTLSTTLSVIRSVRYVTMHLLRTVTVPFGLRVSWKVASPFNLVSHLITLVGFPLDDTQVATVILRFVALATIVGVVKVMRVVGRAVERRTIERDN